MASTERTGIGVVQGISMASKAFAKLSSFFLNGMSVCLLRSVKINYDLKTQCWCESERQPYLIEEFRKKFIVEQRQTNLATSER